MVISVSTSNSSLYFNGEKFTTAVTGPGTLNLTNEITVGARLGKGILLTVTYTNLSSTIKNLTIQDAELSRHI